MAISLAELNTAITSYGRRWPGEDESLLMPFVEAYPSCLSRRTMSGHFTASAAVLDSDGRALLVLHKELKLWLQPGGHLKSRDASLVDAARREASEETGIDPEDLVLEDDAPILINVHGIPENTRKGEAAHSHCDFQYVFRAKRTKLSHCTVEVCAAEWRPRTDLPRPIVVERLQEFC